jgi:hypothetical protein
VHINSRCIRSPGTGTVSFALWHRPSLTDSATWYVHRLQGYIEGHARAHGALRTPPSRCTQGPHDPADEGAKHKKVVDPDSLHVSLTQMLSYDAETRWAARLRQLAAQFVLHNQQHQIVTQHYITNPAVHAQLLATNGEHAGNAILLSHTSNLLWCCWFSRICLPISNHAVRQLQG